MASNPITSDGLQPDASNLITSDDLQPNRWPPTQLLVMASNLMRPT